MGAVRLKVSVCEVENEEFAVAGAKKVFPHDPL
jgi:hypothetical protein